MTGLIYIVIIALWVAVLVPMWLRRHDQISEVRSTAKFSRSMKTLAAMEAHPAGSAREDRMREVREAGAVARLNAQQEAAKRRAVVLAALCGLLVVTLGLGLASVAPMWLAVIALFLVVGFMAATALTASARTASRSRTVSTGRRVVASARAGRAGAPAGGAAAPEAPADDDWLNWNAWDEDDRAWEAVPTTLPTYVTAPRASAVPRPIDKARPGEWTGEAMVDAAQAMRRRVAEVSFEDVDHHAQTAEIPVVRPSRAVAANE